ncbi:MAG: hypothetical protein RL148_1715 [Planctomycetota bacterium]
MWGTVLPLLVVVGAGLATWWEVPTFGFKFDDSPAIELNVPLIDGNWWDAALSPPHQPLANRPVACLSLAACFSLFGFGTVSPHLGNLVVHLLNGMLLFLLARGSLRAPNLAARTDSAGATCLALVLALVWVVHPLCTDSVAYATQRSTLLASGFLLLALYATLRAHGSAHAGRWQLLAVAAMALGMGSKEDLVAGPVLVLLYQRAFLLPDWAALRTQRRFLLAMASTWLVLGACVALGPVNHTVGYSTHQGVTAWQWLLTQAGVLAHYVQLALWPDVLRGAYSNAVVKELGPALLPGLFVLSLLAATAWCWLRRPTLHWLAFLGALFFLWLAPTSTVMPIVTELVAERRMYLPMLFLVVPVVVGTRWLLHRTARGAAGWLGGVLAAVFVAVLAVQARDHAGTYASEATFWKDAYAKRNPDDRGPLAAQILTNLGTVLLEEKREAEAFPLFDLAVQCEFANHADRTNWATSLHMRGRTEDAIVELEKVVAFAPWHADALGALGTCLLIQVDKGGKGAADPRFARAVDVLTKAAELQPRRGMYWNSLGSAHARAGRLAEAIAAFQRAVQLPFDRIHPYLSLDDLLRKAGRGSEADAMWEQLLRERPEELEAHLFLASRAMDARDWPTAQYRLNKARSIAPERRDVQDALREVEANLRR